MFSSVSVQVLRLDVTFQEIMRQYRHQPQAKSHVRTKIQGSHCVLCPIYCVLVLCAGVSQCAAEQWAPQGSTA